MLVIFEFTIKLYVLKNGFMVFENLFLSILVSL